MSWLSRRNVLFAFVGAIILALACGLAYTQLVRGTYYTRIANENRIRVVPVAAPRGRIFDRHGREMVHNRPAFSISVLPADFRGPEARTRLSGVLAITTDELTRRLTRRRTLPLEPVGIVRDADLRTISRLEERVEEFPGIVIATTPEREYPSDSWSGHLFGYLREVNDRDQKRLDKAGRPLRGVIGATGLEKQYDDELRGVDGIGYREMNAFGQIVGAMPDYDDVPPIPGDDLMLSIDWDLQYLADSLLSSYTSGTVVALDVTTGEILCFVTRPGFDANHFVGGMSTQEWEALRNDSLHPLLNRATMGVYPPGSTTKLLTASAALDAGVITATQHFAPCTGGYRLGNRVFKCWKLSGHGALDLRGALEQSCDVYFYQVGLKLGIDRWSEEVAQSGFGRRTGIDLPGETRGIVPSQAYYDELYGKRGWTRGLLLNLAIGQGEFSVTPMQLAVYFAALANNGVGMQPHLVHARRTPGTEWIDTEPEVSLRLPCSSTTQQILREACRRVVAGEDGTASALNDEEVRIAGKTGTAENSHGDEHAWFASYAPSESPRIAVVALVENVGHGSTYAAPICFEIARAYLGVPPRDSEGLVKAE